MKVKIPSYFLKDQPIQNTLFRIPKMSLGLIGFWPGHPMTIFGAIFVSINLFILTGAALDEIYYGFISLQNLIYALDAFCPSITKLVTSLKLFIIIFYRLKFQKVLLKFEAVLFNESNPEKIKIIQNCSQIAFLFGFFVFAFGHATDLTYFSRPLIGNLIQYIKGDNITRDLPFKAALPYDATTMPAYPLTYALLQYSAIITVFGFSGVDSFFIALCLYITAMFRLVQNDLEHLLNAKNKQGQELYHEICKVIDRHNAVIDLCEDIVSLFTIMILGHFLSAAIVICMSLIDFILSSGFGSLLYINYTCAALAQLFMYCLGGNFIADSSAEISNTVYCSLWYECDKPVKNLLGMIIMRSQRGTAVTVPFFSASLPAFMAILSTAGSYVTLLKTFL